MVERREPDLREQVLVISVAWLKFRLLPMTGCSVMLWCSSIYDKPVDTRVETLEMLATPSTLLNGQVLLVLRGRRWHVYNVLGDTNYAGLGSQGSSISDSKTRRLIRTKTSEMLTVPSTLLDAQVSLLLRGRRWHVHKGLGDTHYAGLALNGYISRILQGGRKPVHKNLGNTQYVVLVSQRAHNFVSTRRSINCA